MAIIHGSPGIILSNQILLILEQMNKCVCKVYYENNGTSTGFFCFIPYNNIKFPVLIANYHVISKNYINKNETISLELNNEKKTINIKDRKIYTNEEYDITIIEIDPDKDFIYNFLEIDENIFKEEERFYKDHSIYLPQCDKKVSFGVLKKIDYDEQRIAHACSSDRDSGGSPIMNLSNNKVIGIHYGYQKNMNINLGTFLKKPILEFLDKFKDYINSKKIIPKNESKNFDFENKNKIGENIETEVEKNRILNEKKNQFQNLLNDNSNSNELLKAFLKKDKEIEELKLKLSRFPFELAQGEKLISIIFATTDQKVLYSTICKNTDKFGKIELELYEAYPNYYESVNIFTVNGNKINKSKNLDDNKIKNHDTIILVAKG
jgi:hypothetical protein